MGGKWLYKSNTAALMWKVWSYAYPSVNPVRRRTGDIVFMFADPYMKVLNPHIVRKLERKQNQKHGLIGYVV